MSSFDKTVKLACKPKAKAPKAKYLDPIIAATYSEDGAIHDVCKALSPRFREPNQIVVFKALIVLHTMIRNGSTDNVLTYLSSEDVLKLRNVSGGSWDGYNAPKNLTNYAAYLESRIRTYRELKHDPVKVQSEQNRDARADASIEDSKANTSKAAVQRRATVAGRKLRSMTVEKGLLRETKVVQKCVTTLVECRLYLDNLEDELTVTALRMLVKDLIILFQALNEGVINVLEHYFEMSHVDAEAALSIYRNFCKQTEQVVEYLSVARKLQNLLNVPIPNLKHAPVSLVTALEEYLKDPNFEQNRIEYRTQKALADKGVKEGSKQASKNGNKPGSSSGRATSPKPNPSSSTPKSEPSTSKKEPNQALVDFFSSIEEEQTNMFGSSPSSQFQQQPVHNPFARQSVMVTGAFPQMPFGNPEVPQPTGFIQPQFTAFPGVNTQPSNPMAQPQHPAFSSFLQPQLTSFLQPQATGANPFRQSMLMPQMTGMAAFGPNNTIGTSSSPFQSPEPSFFVPPASSQPQSAHAASFAPAVNSNTIGVNTSPFSVNGTAIQNSPPRPASTPITGGTTKSFGQAVQGVTSHQTGSRNPFGVPQAPAPSVPKPPTLQELTFGNKGIGDLGLPRTQSPIQQQSISPTVGPSVTPFRQFSQTATTNSAPGTNMSDIASSFSFNKSWSLDSSKSPVDSSSVSAASQITPSIFSSQSTGATGSTSAFSSSLPSLQPQTTGFAGLKAFKPTSSFGASLLETLPPIPQSGASSPSASALPSAQPTGAGLTTGIGSLSLNSASDAPRNPSFGGLGSTTLSTSTLPTSNGQSTLTTGLGNPNTQPTTTSNPITPPAFGTFSSTLGAQNTTFPGLGALSTQATGFGGLGGVDSMSPAFSSGLGAGLRPQATGAGFVNPFRASMYSPSATSGIGGAGTEPSFSLNHNALRPNPIGTQLPSGASLFQNGPTDASKQLNGQQNGVASLI